MDEINSAQALRTILEIADIFDRGEKIIIGQMRVVEIVDIAERRGRKRVDMNDVKKAVEKLASIHKSVNPKLGWGRTAQSVYGVAFRLAIKEAVRKGLPYMVERRGEIYEPVADFAAGMEPKRTAA